MYDGVPLTFPDNIGPGFLSNISWLGTDGYEPHTWRVLKHNLVHAGTFIDIGANIGLFSVLAKKAQPAITVIAYEPVPELYESCKRFLLANGVETTVVSQVAISDIDGQVTLFQPLHDTDFGPSSASTLTTGSWQAEKKPLKRTVDAARLDTLLDAQTLRAPVLIKIDVEDHESAVLRGAVKLISKYRPVIICEILPRGHANAETLDILAALGYAVFAITAQGCFRMARADFAKSRYITDFMLLPNTVAPLDHCYIAQ